MYSQSLASAPAETSDVIKQANAIIQANWTLSIIIADKSTACLLSCWLNVYAKNDVPTGNYLPLDRGIVCANEEQVGCPDLEYDPPSAAITSKQTEDSWNDDHY